MVPECKAFVLLAALVLFSFANAEAEPDALCLLQTGTWVQRSSMPSSFFEAENQAQLAPAPAKATPAAALFDVGSNSVPQPRRSGLTSDDSNAEREQLPLDEVQAPLSKPAAAAEQQIEALSRPSADKQRSYSLLDRAADEELKRYKGAPAKLSAAAWARAQALSRLPADNQRTHPFLKKLADQKINNFDAQDHEELARYEALAAEPKMSLLMAQIARLRAKKESRAVEDSNAAFKFLEMEADAAGEDALDTSAVIPQAANSSPELDLIEKQRGFDATVQRLEDDGTRLLELAVLRQDARLT